MANAIDVVVGGHLAKLIILSRNINFLGIGVCHIVKLIRDRNGELCIGYPNYIIAIAVAYSQHKAQSNIVINVAPLVAALNGGLQLICSKSKVTLNIK